VRVSDYFRLSWRAVWERRGRAIGAIVGIIIAILALGLAIGFGQGNWALTMGFFTKVFGVNTVWLIPGHNSELTITDVVMIKRLPHVVDAVPILIMPATVYVNGQERTVIVMGITPQELEQFYGVTSLSNALLSGSPALGPGLVLVGYNIAFTSTGQQVIYPGQVVILNVNGRNLIVTVSGILKQIGHPIVIGINPSDAVFIDENAFLSQLDPYGVVEGIIVYVDSPRNIDYVTNELKALFPMDQVLNPSTLLSSVKLYLTVAEAFLAFVSGISFVIVGIWIFDTMMLNVIQRTREFGIMRAVGFSGRSIPLLLIMEALIMALIGSVIGTTLLAVVAQFLPSPNTVMMAAMRGAFMLPFELTPLNYIVLFLIPIVINVIATLLPAIRAMRIPPAQTLRYE
jgi:putative ABC transport system permease protein